MEPDSVAWVLEKLNLNVGKLHWNLLTALGGRVAAVARSCTAAPAGAALPVDFSPVW